MKLLRRVQASFPAGISARLRRAVAGRRRVAVAALSTLLVAGAALAAHALWLPVKAQVAQALLEEAWQRARDGQPQPRPWPWADTWPVGRLSLPATAGGGDQPLVVLAGASGRTLAFGPGHLTGSAPPGAVGNVVIAGHRDTHFRALRLLVPGDEVTLEDRLGGRRSYRVVDRAVVRYDDTSALAPAADRLTLVTCWPFDTLHPGGPMRYVVTAEAVPVAPRPATTLAAARPASGYRSGSPANSPVTSPLPSPATSPATSSATSPAG